MEIFTSTSLQRPLEDKITIKSIGVWWYLSLKIYVWEKQLIRFLGWNFSCHKTHRFNWAKTCAAGRANNIELSML